MQSVAYSVINYSASIQHHSSILNCIKALNPDQDLCRATAKIRLINSDMYARFPYVFFRSRGLIQGSSDVLSIKTHFVFLAQ